VRAVLLGLGGAVPAAAAAYRLLQDPETTPRIVPAQGWMLLFFQLLAGRLGVGLLIG
jgi:hypothetical protein